MFTLLSFCHCHCKSSPGSSDEYSTSTEWLSTSGPSRLTWATDPPKLAAIVTAITIDYLLPLSQKADTHFTISWRVKTESTWLAGYVVRWSTCPQTVTHPSTNRARHSVTLLIGDNALLPHHATNRRCERDWKSQTDCTTNVTYMPCERDLSYRQMLLTGSVKET